MKFKPSQKQLGFLSWEFGVFFHFGIRSFYPGHKDWDGIPMPASGFDPERLDCRQWCRLAQKAGARYAILVTKHHDGFANWPSKYSDYSVAQTPWRGGKGDVVKEFTDACRQYGLKVGLYYSPAQWGGAVSFERAEEYDDYFIAQISELLTNYGRIDYLWFDGCGSGDHEYDRQRIITTIRTLQPEIAIFSMWDPDTRWVGNEDGYAAMPCGNVVSKDNWITDGDRWLPAECDMRMRSAWFDCEANEDTIKSVEELVGIYEYSVGRGANLLLNIGPDHRGLIPEADAARLLEFGDELRRRYASPLAFTDLCEDGEGAWSISLRDPAASLHPEQKGTDLVNTLVIEEDVTEGEAILEYAVEARLPCGSHAIRLVHGDTIGHKAIVHFPTMRTGKITVRVLRAEEGARLKAIRAYCV